MEWIAVGDSGWIGRVVDLRSGRDLLRAKLDGEVLTTALSPDGQWVAMGTYRGTFVVFRVDDRKKILLNQAGYVHAAAFSPDGRWLATVGNDYTVRLWAAPDGPERWRFSDQYPISRLAFSANSQFLMFAGGRANARVLLTDTGEELATVALPGDPRAVGTARNGRVLISVSDVNKPGAAVEFDWLYGEDLQREACSRMMRNLTQEEWRRYLNDQPYEKTCPDLPVPPEQHPARNTRLRLRPPPYLKGNLRTARNRMCL